MRRFAVLLLLAAACHRRTAPEAALEAYANAVRKHDCNAAWSMLSHDTQEALTYVAQTPGYSRSAKQMGCDAAWIDSMRGDELKTKQQTATLATVIVKKQQPVDLVFENGAWRVVQREIVDLVAARRRTIDVNARRRRP